MQPLAGVLHENGGHPGQTRTRLHRGLPGSREPQALAGAVDHMRQGEVRLERLPLSLFV